MEIYKLTDEIPDKQQKRVAGFDGDYVDKKLRQDFSELKITDIKQAVKNENRVNIFVNGKYSFSLDVAQAVELKIKIGSVITAEKLAEYKKTSEYGKAYQRALEWVLVRPRSERELRDYLKRRERTAEMKERQKEWQMEKETGKKPKKQREKYDFDDLIVARILEKGYVDDGKFAEYYVENRFVKKGISKRRLAQELMKKGVKKEIIDEVLSARNDDEEILKMIVKKRAKYDDEKLISYLCRQGFDYQRVQNLVRTYETD